MNVRSSAPEYGQSVCLDQESYQIDHKMPTSLVSLAQDELTQISYVRVANADPFMIGLEINT